MLLICDYLKFMGWDIADYDSIQPHQQIVVVEKPFESRKNSVYIAECTTNSGILRARYYVLLKPTNRLNPLQTLRGNLNIVSRDQLVFDVNSNISALAELIRTMDTTLGEWRGHIIEQFRLSLSTFSELDLLESKIMPLFSDINRNLERQG